MKEAVVKMLKKLSKERAQKACKDFNEIQDRLNVLQQRMSGLHDNEVKKEIVLNEFEAENSRLHKHIERKAAGAKIRSRCKYYEYGEKGTKYFLGLEKVKYSNKTIKILQCEDNTVTRDEKKILKEQFNFYRKLYSKDPKVRFILQNNNMHTLNEAETKMIDEEFTLEDFTNALKNMSRNKCLGNDGLSMEFYVIFWDKLGSLIWDAMKLSHKRGMLYRSARRGVISLIPKKLKDATLLKSFRPLCLLNVDCKILTKMLADRLKPFLERIIGPQQTGYVPDRFIGINLRKMIDLLMYLEREEVPAVLLSLDFEKCFDSISHEALYKSLEYFGIGEYYISWVKVVYNNFELCTINNGRWTKYFPQERGVHQGCALSGPIFLFVTEILAINVKNNKLIQGIKIGENEEVISQYADDANIWSLYKEESINAVIEELKKFRKSTGLKVNYEKSTIYRVGSLRNEDKKLKLDKPFKWASGRVDTLGLVVNIQDLQSCDDDNYDKILEKMASTLNLWKSRGMSLLGKIEIVNSLIGSLFVYKMQVLPVASKQVHARINKLVTDFIWNARKPKIRTETLSLSKECGGRKLVDTYKRDCALKIEWIRRIIEMHNPILCGLAFYHMNVEIRNHLIWECNFAAQDVADINCQHPFWNDVMTQWAELNYKIPDSQEEVANQILWYNSHLKVGGKLYLKRKLYEKGILYVKDLFVGPITMSFNEMKDSYGQDIKAMDYNTIMSTIPSHWKDILKHSIPVDLEHYSTVCELLDKNKWSKIVYAKNIHDNEYLEKCKNLLVKNTAGTNRSHRHKESFP